MMSVAEQLSKEILHFKADDLPLDVIHQAKRLVLDTLGCAIGGYSSEASRAIQALICNLDGPAAGSQAGMRTSC
jgi:2-methylcitrate dehydratase